MILKLFVRFNFVRKNYKAEVFNCLLNHTYFLRNCIRASSLPKVKIPLASIKTCIINSKEQQNVSVSKGIREGENRKWMLVSIRLKHS